MSKFRGFGEAEKHGHTEGMRTFQLTDVPHRQVYSLNAEVLIVMFFIL